VLWCSNVLFATGYQIIQHIPEGTFINSQRFPNKSLHTWDIFCSFRLRLVPIVMEWIKSFLSRYQSIGIPSETHNPNSNAIVRINISFLYGVPPTWSTLRKNQTILCSMFRRKKNSVVGFPGKMYSIGIQVRQQWTRNQSSIIIKKKKKKKKIRTLPHWETALFQRSVFHLSIIYKVLWAVACVSSTSIEENIKVSFIHL